MKLRLNISAEKKYRSDKDEKEGYIVFSYHQIVFEDEDMTGEDILEDTETNVEEDAMAYKSLDDIIDVIRDSVDIIDIMKPVYNFKASDDDLPWKKKKAKTDEGTDCQETETD